MPAIAVTRSPGRRSAHERFTPSFVPRLAAIPREPDVLVLGAGAAGIAAARQLMAQGLSVAVLEARARVGGRAVTTMLRGHPIDLGAHWLHAGPVNPLVALGQARGEPLRQAAQNSHLMIGRSFARAAEKRAFRRAFDLADLAMTREAGRAGADRPAGSVQAPGLGPWRARIDLVHALVSGRPLSEVSLHDWPSMEYGDNYFIRGGYGAYLARLAQDLPIALDTEVLGLDWSGAGVRVETSRGTLAARAVIVTLPIMVLQAAFRFAPALPDQARSAIDGFASGVYEHVVLHWPGSPFRGADRLASVVGGRHRPPGMLARIDGTPFHYVELDAALADRLDTQEGPDAARRLARAILADHASINGMSIPAVTEWRHDPFSRGSWAVVPPGHAQARITLRESVGERIWFAGEALSREQWGTVGGAWAEGERAADALAASLSSPAEPIGQAARNRKRVS